MSWLNDLAAASGVPGGAAMLAGSIYAACTAAEKAARPQALEEIGRIFIDPSWAHSVGAPALVKRIFELTFGSRHFTWKCIVRSTLASIVFIASVFIASSQIGIDESRLGMLSILTRSDWVIDYALKFPLLFLVTFLVCGVLPDYIAMAKTRLLLGYTARRAKGALVIFVLICADVICSLFISVTLVFGLLYLVSVIEPLLLSARLLSESDASESTVMIFSGGQAMAMGMFISTLLTSTWMALIFPSTYLLRLASVVQRFSIFFFDVKQHPLQALGVATGALVMSVACAWTLIAKII